MLPNLAAELVRLKPDVIFASGTPPALAVKKATTSIPIVFARVGDPVGFRAGAAASASVSTSVASSGWDMPTSLRH